MRRLMLLFCLLISGPGFGKMEVLPAAKINALKQKKCTFVHVWATWCTICIKEMPQLLKILVDQGPSVQPAIIDISAPFVQDNFSKKWMVQLNPPFTTYLKPAGSDKNYMRYVDKDWNGILPFSALYDGGKRKKVWEGEIPLEKLKGDISKYCH
jgi:thiol-disulfide isomerase/thioredoxin